MESVESSVRNAVLKKLAPNQNLLAVSKLQPVEKIRKLYSQGQRHFGENYVQEALEKIEQLRDLNISWHLIGPIQKNKVKYLKNHFEYIHSIHNFELAKKISEASISNGLIQKIFLQVNIAEEISKSGFTVPEISELIPELKRLPGVEIVGLMTMPPLESRPDESRVHFRNLREIGIKFSLKQFSMGTSHDYEIALQEGATWIRLGTMLFGDRKTIIHQN